MNRRPDTNHDRVFVNHAIRAYEVLCIDHNNNNLGKMSRAQAISLAQSHGLDLVQVSASGETPTCRITDSGKFKYEQSKRKKETERKQRENVIKVKEIKFHPDTDDNDLRWKAKKTEDFLAEGCRVKVSVFFSGREITRQEVGHQTLKNFLALITNGQVEGRPTLDNRNLITYLSKKIEK